MSHIGQYNGAVLPGNPPFDKVAALVLLVEQVTGKLEWPSNFMIEFYRANQEPPEELQQKWEESKLYPIDIGRNKYHQRKARSATEVVTNDLGINLQSSPEIAWLVNQANDNNRTGDLKKLARGNNMPWTVRELYKPQMFTNPVLAVEMAAHVIMTELKFRRMKSRDNWLRQPKDADDSPVMVKARSAMPGSTDPFTFSRYAFTMWVTGEAEDTIARRMDFWISNYKKAQRRNVDARGKAEDMDKEEFYVSGQRCVYIITDDDRVARALFTDQKNAPALILAQRRDGSFQVLSHKRYWKYEAFKTSMFQAYNRIQGREVSQGEKIWFFDDRICAIMNGSRSLSKSTPSGLRASAVIDILEETVAFPQDEKTAVNAPEAKKEPNGTLR